MEKVQAFRELDRYFGQVPYKWKRPVDQQPEPGQRVLLESYNVTVTSERKPGLTGGVLTIRTYGPAPCVGRMVSWDGEKQTITLQRRGEDVVAHCHGVWTKWAPLPEAIGDEVAEEWATAKLTEKNEKND